MAATGVAGDTLTFAYRIRTSTAFPNEVHTTVPSVVVAPFTVLKLGNPINLTAVVPPVVALNNHPFKTTYVLIATTVLVPGYRGEIQSMPPNTMPVVSVGPSWRI